MIIIAISNPYLCGGFTAFVGSGVLCVIGISASLFSGRTPALGAGSLLPVRLEKRFLIALTILSAVFGLTILTAANIIKSLSPIENIFYPF
ncbi:hypothetical protein [Helicobacter ailurogastricus]|uniref:hypothetical protein n=1 Tax=Helicobacter ailurogastricus TaxID=1578720 RepID=UPI002492FEAE|nr:hypothetical protein [Helicobacter ailurogastricus]